MTATAAAAAVASFGLDGARPFPPAPLPGDRFEQLLHECEQHRLLGHLGAAAAAGGLPVTVAECGAITEALDHWLAHCLRVERLLLGALDRLDTAGIATRVLKGVALAHLVYPDPARRVFADADVLVQPDRFSDAAALLVTDGSVRRAVPELRPGFDDRFGREILLVAPGEPNELELDVHRTFVDGPYGLLLDPHELFRSSTPFTVGNRRLHALDTEDLFLHVCYNAVLGDRPPRLAALRDVAQLWAVRPPDRAEVLARARRRGAEVLVARAVRLTVQTLGPGSVPELAGWSAVHRVTARDRVMLASYHGRARALTEKVTTAGVIPGAGGRLSYLYAIAVPQRSYLRARRLSRFDYAVQSLGSG